MFIQQKYFSQEEKDSAKEVAEKDMESKNDDSVRSNAKKTFKVIEKEGLKEKKI